MRNTHVGCWTWMKSSCYILYGWIAEFSVINFGKYFTCYIAFDSKTQAAEHIKSWPQCIFNFFTVLWTGNPTYCQAAVLSDSISLQSMQAEVYQQWCQNPLWNLGWRTRVVVFRHINFVNWRHFIPMNNKGTEGNTNI